MTDSNVTFVLLVIAGAILLYMVGAITGSEGKKSLRSEFSDWSPRHLYVGLVCFFGGIHTLVMHVPLHGSDPLVRWGVPILGVVLVVIGFLMSMKMIKNWKSRRDSDGTSI